MEPTVTQHDLPPVKKLLFSLTPQGPHSAKTDSLSGLTVALALVPEAVAFAFLAGVDPLIGLYSAFFLCLLTTLLGGRPGMISGATGAMGVVIVALVAGHEHGVLYLFPTVILCGLIQLAVGVLRWGKFIRMVPHPVMLGFVNGLAIVIGMAQIKSFKQFSADGQWHWLGGVSLGLMIGGVMLTMAIIHFLPRLTKAVPATLVAIVLVSLAGVGINHQFGGDKGNLMPTVRDMLVQGQQDATVIKQGRNIIQKRKAEIAAVAGSSLSVSASASPQAVQSPAQISSAIDSVDTAEISMSGGLPKLFFMDSKYSNWREVLFQWKTLWIIWPYALILAGVGLIESLMTLQLVDEITETRGRSNRECLGQGVANTVCGLFGGMGGCAMIGQSLINVKSGGRGRLSGIVAACGLLAFVLFLAPLIERVPMAALVGVMFMVVVGTFEWATLRTWRRLPMSDVVIMLSVTLVTVFLHNLALAVLVGIVIAALVFAWQHATHLFADTKYNEFGTKIYQLHGPLFFASVTSFKDIFQISDDPQDVVIDFYYTRVYDQSGLEAIHTVAEKYRENGKTVHLRHLSDECRQTLEKAGDLVEVNISEDPHYHVATDRLTLDD